jgi:dolichol-phosphate mannosyltransferase
VSAPLLSIVVPVFNEAPVLAELHRRLSTLLQEAKVSYELVLVDDGSSDGSWEMMQTLRSTDPNVHLVQLSRNFGHQVAVTAGIDAACGEAVAIMDADLQDPPEVLLEMLARYREGYDVVYGRRTRRAGETIFKRASASLFYRFIRALTAVDIPADTGDFRLMSRRAVEGLKQARERHRFLRGMVAWLGFRQIAVPYARAARHAGSTKYPLRKMVAFALDAVVSFSIAPLRLATGLGLIVSLSSFGYAAYAVYVKVGLGVALPGWTSLMVAVVFLGGVQLLCIGILGEYLGRIYDEVKQRPLYLLQEKSGPHEEAQRGVVADRSATS